MSNYWLRVRRHREQRRHSKALTRGRLGRLGRRSPMCRHVHWFCVNEQPGTVRSRRATLIGIVQPAREVRRGYGGRHRLRRYW